MSDKKPKKQRALTPAAFKQEVHASIDCSCCASKTLINKSEAVAFQTLRKSCPVCGSMHCGVFVLSAADHAKYNKMRGVKPATAEEDAINDSLVQ